MKNPGIGALNRRVVIRERVDLPDDDTGDLESVFPEAGKTWASIEPVGSVVYSAGVQADSRITHRVTIRYRNGVTDGHEVVELVNGVRTVYRVRRSAPLGRSRLFTVLEVEEL